MIDAVIYTLLMGREAVYILGNLAKIDPELIPATLRARLELAIMAVPNRIIDNLATSPPERLPADKMDSPLPPDTAPVSLAEKTP